MEMSILRGGESQGFIPVFPNKTWRQCFLDSVDPRHTFIQVCAQSCSQRQSLYMSFLYMYVYVYRKAWFIRPGRARLIFSSAGAFLAHAGKIKWHLCDVPELWDCLICLDFNLLRQSQFSMCTQQNRALILLQVAEWHCEQIKGVDAAWSCCTKGMKWHLKCCSWPY